MFNPLVSNSCNVPARWVAFLGAALMVFAAWLDAPAAAQTAFGEIEGRPAPVSRRQCIAGANAGALCNEDADCPASTCQPSNLYNVSVAVRFNASAAQLTAIENAFTAGSELLFDVTDGQAQFGRVTIFNNSSGDRGHFWIWPGAGGCGAATGTFGTYTGGNIDIAMDQLTGSAAVAAGCIAHEFVHFVFDAKDEYEKGCGLSGSATCPDDSQGPNSAAEEACLMICCLEVGTELCWGQASGDDLSGGNHDADNVTEQSRCRSNRSCWDQVGWSWPETMLVPVGAPDADANGLVHQPLDFVQPPATARLVLVLDRSGSMSSESPSRLERLKTAALDVVDIAEDGVELGLVSFSTIASDEVAIAALGADRSAYNTAINGLSASGATNIGDGLQHAYDMIIAAGGVTTETAVFLMTDGRNNQPPGTYETDLQDKIDLLLAEGIPVYVTCTGDDLGLDSQCSEIATGTNGTYVDSADAALLPQRFARFYEMLEGRHPTVSYRDDFRNSQYKFRYPVEVEPGARAATFVTQWRSGRIRASMDVVDPDGVAHPAQGMPLGAYFRVSDPKPGTWLVRLDPAGGTDLQTGTAAFVVGDKKIFGGDKKVPAGDTTFVVDGYVDNPLLTVPAAARHKVIQPGEAFHVCAWPLQTRRITGMSITGQVTTPRGRQVPITLYDDGDSKHGDEDAADGTFCALFTDTRERGAYTFRLRTVAPSPQPVIDPQPGVVPTQVELVPFSRWTEFSATVDDTVRDGPGPAGDLRVEISPFLGVFDLDSALPIDDGAVRGVRVGVSRWPRWDLEGELAVTPTDDRAGDDGAVVQVSLNALYHFTDPARRWRPFVTAGVGGLVFTGFTNDDTVLAWNLGAGLKARLIRNVSLRLDLRDYFANDAYGTGTTNNLQATGALVFRLD